MNRASLNRCDFTLTIGNGAEKKAVNDSALVVEVERRLPGRGIGVAHGGSGLSVSLGVHQQCGQIIVNIGSKLHGRWEKNYV